MKSFSLRELEAKLSKVVTVVSTEKDDEGMYVWRDSAGEAYKWGPSPESYEFHEVQTVAEADHVDFLCPLCFEKNGGVVGTHHVRVTFAGRNVPDEAGSRGANGPTRWEVSGTSLDDLVLTPSILFNQSAPADVGCHWHGWAGCNGNVPGHAG